MSKKNLIVSLLSLGLLVSCGGKPAESSPAASSTPETSSKTESSKPADSSKPATSSSKPAASSSTPAASSSKPAASSSTPAAHAHAWTAGAKTGKVTPETCGTEHKAYRLDVADAEGWNKADTKMNGKPTAEGPTATSQSKWTIEAGQLPAGKYDIEIVGKMTYSTHSDRHWYNQYETDTSDTGDKETESPFRYWVEVGETKYDPTVRESWGEIGFTSTEMNSVKNAVGVTVAAGATEIKLEHGNIGYSLIIESVRFVLVEAAPEVQAEVSYSHLDLVTENSKAYIELKGTMTGLTGAAQKLAFGLTHKSVTSVDDGTAGWLVGKETPVDADYTIVPTVAADGSFTAKIDVSAITFATGAYAVYAGPKGFYKDITAELTGQNGQGSAEGSQFGGTKAKTSTHKLYFRDDVKALIADELPPVALEEAFYEAGTGEDAGKIFVFIGGALGVAEATFKAYTPFVQFQNTGNWSTVRLDNQEGKVDLVVRNGKGYVKADISSLGAGNWNTHLNIKANTQADCKMDVSLDTRETPFVSGKKEYAVYSNPAASQQNEFWGNLGLVIGNHPTPVTGSTMRLEAEDAHGLNNCTLTEKGEDAAVSGTHYAKDLTTTGNNWSRNYGTVEFALDFQVADDYEIKVAYKSATTSQAFELTIDGQSKGNKGAAAAEWTVLSAGIYSFTAGKHTVAVRGISNVKADIDYIELVKHNHAAAMTWGEAGAAAEGLSAKADGTDACGKTGIKMMASADLNGVLTTDGAKLPKGASGSYDGTKIASYKFAAAAAGKATIYVEAAFDSTNDNANKSFYSRKSGTGANTVMKINAAEITLPTANYGTLLGVSTKDTYGFAKIAEVDVVEGTNEFTMTAIESYGLLYKSVIVVF